jgi:3-isopropylmalate/(R)-2-methylmalate dehydratase large subunit
MGMTLTEKILAHHAGLEKVSPGDLIDAEIDVIMGHDLSTPLAIKEMERIGADRVFDPEKIVIVPDHFTPNKDLKTAEICKMLRTFCKDQGISHFFEVGRMGISHALLPEQGLVLPGDLVVGGDSHTCTYGALGCFSTGIGSTDLAAAMMTGRLWFKVPVSMKFVFQGDLNKWVCGKDLILHTIADIGVDGALYSAMEFCGSTIDGLAISDRLTMANMAVEAGAKNGIFQADGRTEEYIEQSAKRPYKIFRSDPDAAYVHVRTYDVSRIEPQVAVPHSPAIRDPWTSWSTSA